MFVLLCSEQLLPVLDFEWVYLAVDIVNEKRGRCVRRRKGGHQQHVQHLKLTYTISELHPEWHYAGSDQQARVKDWVERISRGSWWYWTLPGSERGESEGVTSSGMSYSPFKRCFLTRVLASLPTVSAPPGSDPSDSFGMIDVYDVIDA
ncbi:hypothetical protein M378DRAFT_919506 [Amanita muscaria Koide BX008]|uniref:Uncharacterized protein n=1 Tax=Amanita muscaria (strain Koide BX008) TaxID=946122 RepID=A0A0C2WVN1_AMAMK|nr:hypothetical protein M378DRAFT_919506 [Amanita muscaria Koide BX008]